MNLSPSGDDSEGGLSQLHQEAKIQLLVNASLDEFNGIVRSNKKFNQLAYTSPTSERIFKERSEKYFPQFIPFKDLDKNLYVPPDRKYRYRESKFSVAGQVRKPISWQEFYKRIEYLFRNIEKFSVSVSRNIGYTTTGEKNAANNLIAENRLMEAIILANMPNPIYPTEYAIFYALANANMDSLNYLYANYPELFSNLEGWNLTNYQLKTMQSNNVEIFKRAQEIHPSSIVPELLMYENAPNIVEYLLQNYPELPPVYDPRRTMRMQKLKESISLYDYTPATRIDLLERIADDKIDHDKINALADLLLRYGKLLE